jgi:CHAT domain-containing protein/tetratricopeptide (TPR) repeat protein
VIYWNSSLLVQWFKKWSKIMANPLADESSEKSFDYLLDKLRHLLAGDPEEGLAFFKELFFDALGARRFDECEKLLAILASGAELFLQQAARHYRAVMRFEQHLLDDAEAILLELLAEELRLQQRASSLLELALTLDEQGRWEESQRISLDALAAYAQIGNTSGQMKAYNNLGISICFQVSQKGAELACLNEAIEYHQRSMALARLPQDDWEQAKNHHGLGKIYSQLSNYAGAQSEFELYLAACTTYNEGHARAYTLADMAIWVYMPQGRSAEALALLNQAIPLLREFNDSVNLSEALIHLGDLMDAEENAQVALSHYQEAVAEVESVRNRLTAPTVQARYRATVEAVYARLLTFHLRRGDAGTAFSTAEQARARVLADLLAGQFAQPHANLPASLLEERDKWLRQLDQGYAALAAYLAGEAEEPPPDLAELEQKLVEVERRLELEDPSYASLSRIKPLAAAQIQAQLPPGAVVLTYVADSDDQIWILALTAETVQAHLVPRLKAHWLQELLRDHLDGQRRGTLVPNPTTNQLTQQRLFSDLYQALIVPVMALVEEAHTLYIIPFGPLYYLPVGAFVPTADSPPPLLAAGRRVVYAPSATVLLTYCHSRPPSPNEGVLAIAPTSTHAQVTYGATRTLASLKKSRALIGEEATRRALTAAAPEHRVICFFGHAKFDQEHPMWSYVELTDGWLRATDILQGVRYHADLVILAACETGRAEVLRGDEILGLTRAIFYAGTPSLLVTLWSVYDIPTRLLLEAIFRQLTEQGGLDRSLDAALALAAAQNWLRTLTFAEALQRMDAWDDLTPVLAEMRLTELWQMAHPGQAPYPDGCPFAHPYFWSPYILIGGRDDRVNDERVEEQVIDAISG